MNRTMAEMYDKSFNIEIKEQVERLLNYLSSLSLFQGEEGTWAKIDSDKEPLFEYIKTLVQMDIYKSLPLLLRLINDLERNMPFDEKVPISEQNEEAFFRIAVHMDIDNEPFTYKRLAGDKTASVLYFYCENDREKGLLAYQTRLSLLKSDMSDLAKKMIRVSEYHKSHDRPEEEKQESPARPLVPKLPK